MYLKHTTDLKIKKIKTKVKVLNVNFIKHISLRIIKKQMHFLISRQNLFFRTNRFKPFIFKKKNMVNKYLLSYSFFIITTFLKLNKKTNMKKRIYFLTKALKKRTLFLVPLVKSSKIIKKNRYAIKCIYNKKFIFKNIINRLLLRKIKKKKQVKKVNLKIFHKQFAVINLFYLNKYYINLYDNTSQLENWIIAVKKNQIISKNLYTKFTAFKKIVRNNDKKCKIIQQRSFSYTKQQQQLIIWNKKNYFLNRKLQTIKHIKKNLIKRKKFAINKKYKRILKKRFTIDWEYNNKFINLVFHKKKIKKTKLVAMEKHKRIFWKKKNSVYKKTIMLNVHVFIKQKKDILAVLKKKNKIFFKSHLRKLKNYNVLQQKDVKLLASKLRFFPRFHMLFSAYIIKVYLFIFLGLKYIYKKINLKKQIIFKNFLHTVSLSFKKQSYSTFFFWHKLNKIEHNILLKTKKRAKYIKKMLKIFSIIQQQKLMVKRFAFIFVLLQKKNNLFKQFLNFFILIQNKQKKYEVQNLYIYSFKKKILMLNIKPFKYIYFYVNCFFNLFIYKPKVPGNIKLITAIKQLMQYSLILLKKNIKPRATIKFFSSFLLKFQRLLYKTTIIKYNYFNQLHLIPFYIYLQFKHLQQKKELKFIFKTIRSKKLKHMNLKNNAFLDYYLYKNINSFVLMKNQLQIVNLNQNVDLYKPKILIYWMARNKKNNTLIKKIYFKTCTLINKSIVNTIKKNFIIYKTQTFWITFLQDFNLYNKLLIKKYTFLNFSKIFLISNKIILFLFLQMQQLLITYFNKQLDFLSLNLIKKFQTLNKTNIFIYKLYAHLNNALIFYLHNKQQKYQIN